MTLTKYKNAHRVRRECLIGVAQQPFFPHVKLIRLQSGPLACVYQDEDTAAAEREGSGVYRAFSGSVEVAGTSESDALDTLDRSLARLSSMPAADSEEDAASAGNETEQCPPRFHSILPPSIDGAPDTVRAPRPSSLPTIVVGKSALARFAKMSQYLDE